MVRLTRAIADMTQPLISFCAIVKNEKQHLPRCLSSVRPYVDEMIVVDTGSEYETPEIARQQVALCLTSKIYAVNFKPLHTELHLQENRCKML